MTAPHLKSLADRIERLMDERDGIQSDIRDIYAEAKSHGYVPKVLRKAITRKRMDPSKRDEEDSILELYEGALTGPMREAVSMAAKGASARQIEEATGIDQATVARSVSLNKKSETISPNKEVDLPGVDAGRRSEPSSPAAPRGPSPIGAVNPGPPPGREPTSHTGKGGDPAPIHESCGAHTGGGVEVSAAPPVPRADATAPPQDLDLDAGSIPPFLDRRSQAVRAA